VVLTVLPVLLILLGCAAAAAMKTPSRRRQALKLS